jgi:hypothetical protein
MHGQQNIKYESHLSICVKCRLPCPILNKFDFSERIFMKVPNIKFRENPSSGSHADKCAQTDGRTEITKRIDAFLDNANAPKKNFNSKHAELEPTIQIAWFERQKVVILTVGDTHARWQ